MKTMNAKMIEALRAVLKEPTQPVTTFLTTMFLVLCSGMAMIFTHNFCVAVAALILSVAIAITFYVFVRNTEEEK